MRNIKVYWLSIILVIFLIISYQAYLYFSYGGNLIVYVSNQTNVEKIDLLIKVDDDSIFNFNSLANDDMINKRYILKESIGYHQLRIEIKKPELNLLYTFSLMRVKWIIINVLEDEENEKIYLSIDSNSILPPLFQ